MDAAITAEGLERSFDGVVAVDRIDLSIAPGEIYGFLGPNGAGKSTTVRMLCTLLAPTGGRAVVAGADVAREPELVRLRIGVALQDAALDPKATGTELLRLQARLYGLTRGEADQRISELAALIDIGDALGKQIGTYSGGMRRRLDLAVALVHNPEIAVPRRADDRARSGEPRARVGGGAPLERRPRHDDLPHDAVPRRGRRAGGPRRHHRRGPSGRARARPTSSSGRSAPTSSWPGSTATSTWPAVRSPASMVSGPSKSTATS